MMKTFLLCVGAIFALAVQAQNDQKQACDTTIADAATRLVLAEERLAQTEERLAQAEERINQLETNYNAKKLQNMPKHEVGFTLGIPGFIIRGVPEHHDDNISHFIEWEDQSVVSELNYLYNFNKHWAIGVETSYSHAEDHCEEIAWITDDEGASYWDFTGRSNNARYSILTIMPEVRAFWFQRRHFGMYSRLAIGFSLVHLNQKLDGVYKHMYVDPAFELVPVGFDFGGQHWRGKVELYNIGETFVGSVGLSYRF